MLNEKTKQQQNNHHQLIVKISNEKRKTNFEDHEQ